MISVHHLQVGNRLQVAELIFKPGELTFLLGENGAGKSTLLTAMAGLDVPVNANIQLFGTCVHTLSLSMLAARRTWLGQQTSTHFPLSTYELLSFYTSNLTTERMSKKEDLIVIITLSIHGIFDGSGHI